MKYTSTTSNSKSVTAKEAIIRGIADDGGLYVPENIPSLSELGYELAELVRLPYIDMAYAILHPFLNFADKELRECVEKAYAPRRFRSPKTAPIVTPFKSDETTHFLELFHGPTLAFKDMALSILPHLMTSSKSEAELVILTATSGDTGKAALEAFSDVKGTSIIVFYPENGVSATQKRQMITQEGDNTHVFGIKGNFDDAQTAVKKIFTDPVLAKKLEAKGKIFSSANSINIGRLLPQIVYYFYAYGQLVEKATLKLGEPLNFVVPTGNFGNILAGYYAKEMGLPIGKLICASNDNKILYDFFRTGTYDKNRQFHCTISPSMDILISSNLERLLYHATDAASVKAMMESLSGNGDKGGRFETTATFPDFYGVHTSEEETKAAILKAWKNGYVIDPHTAVAYHAGERYKEETGDKSQQVVISTASPFKFSEDVLSALGFDVDKNEDSAVILAEKTGLALPDEVSRLANLPVRHNIVCEIEEMQKYII